MNKVLRATYQNGSLILDEKLDASLEGKKLTLILVVEENPATSSAKESDTKEDLEERKRGFLEWAKQYSAKLPPAYKFDREEAHER